MHAPCRFDPRSAMPAIERRRSTTVRVLAPGLIGLRIKELLDAADQ